MLSRWWQLRLQNAYMDNICRSNVQIHYIMLKEKHRSLLIKTVHGKLERTSRFQIKYWNLDFVHVGLQPFNWNTLVVDSDTFIVLVHSYLEKMT